MPKMNELIAGNKERLALYHARRRLSVSIIDGMGRGARARVARDTGISPSTITTILKGWLISEATLTVVEEWVEKQLAGDTNADSTGRPGESREDDYRE